MTEPIDVAAAVDPARSAGDALLVAALRDTGSGDRRAFERLYQLTSVKLFSVCRRILPERHDAEDALQDAYLNVWRHATGYDAARGRPMTWLITVAHRCAIDRLRRRRAAGEQQPLDLSGSEPAMSDASPATGQLAACLRGLDRYDETLLRTAFFEGATYAEIAVRSAQPLGTIKSRIRRALLKLAECLR